MKRLKSLWVFTALFCIHLAATQDLPDSQTVGLGGCTFEGVRYNNGDAILVRDAPCVRCICKLGVPECRVRMCPPLPDPPPRGCLIVHQHDACCANLKCSHGPPENVTQIRDILEAEQQKQQFLSSNRLRSDERTDGTCIIGGTRYATGSALSSSSLCRHCFCVRGRERCVSPRCVLPAPGCRPVFRAPTCCPVKYDCRKEVSNKTETEIVVSTMPGSKITVKHTKSRGCVVNGRRYTDGASIPAAARSPCESCFCLRGQVRCAHSRCAGPLDGCTPIVAPGRCCPISYDCAGESSNTTLAEEPSHSNKETAQWENQVRSLGGLALIPTDSRSHREVSSAAFSTVQTPPTSPQIVTTPKAIIVSESRHVKTNKNITFLTTKVSAGMKVDADNTQAERRSGQKTATNESRKKNEDYDYDYMSLPPSLPNLRIIPFVAADAVTSDDKPKEKVSIPAVPMVEEKNPMAEIQTKTEDPDVKFSPPKAVEGGFEPKQPPMEGPFLQTKFVVPFITASVNGPVVNSDSSSNEEIEQTEKLNIEKAETKQPAANEETTTTTEATKPNIKKGALCMVDGRPYRHGELVSSPSACELCVCHDSQVQCQPPLCGPAPDGCRRLPRRGACCGPILCAPTPLIAPNTHAKPPDEPMVPVSTITPPSVTLKTNKISTVKIHSTTALPTSSTQTTTIQRDTSTFMSTPSTSTSTVETPTSTQSTSAVRQTTSTTTTTISPRSKTTPNPSSTEADILRNPTTTQGSTTTEVGILRVPVTTQKPVSGPTPTSTSKRPATTVSFLQALWGDTDNSENEAQDKIDHNYEDPAPQTHQEEQNDDSFSFDKVFELLFSSGETTTKPKTTTKVPLRRPITRTTTTTTTPKYETPPQYVTPTQYVTPLTTISSTTMTTVPSTSTENVTRTSTTPKTTTTLLYITRLTSTPKTTPVQFVTPITAATPKTTITTTTQSTRVTSTTPKLSFWQFVTPTIPTTPKPTIRVTQPSTITAKTRPTQVTNLPETSTKTYFATSTRRPPNPVRYTQTISHRSPLPILSLRITTPKPFTSTERITTTLENFIPPPTRASLYGRPFAGSKPVQHSEPINVLKLAGCNIYGRMYRVGRIIVELSGPCKECSCTEFGVQCRHLVC